MFQLSFQLSMQLSAIFFCCEVGTARATDSLNDPIHFKTRLAEAWEWNEKYFSYNKTLRLECQSDEATLCSVLCGRPRSCVWSQEAAVRDTFGHSSTRLMKWFAKLPLYTDRKKKFEVLELETLRHHFNNSHFISIGSKSVHNLGLKWSGDELRARLLKLCEGNSFVANEVIAILSVDKTHAGLPTLGGDLGVWCGFHPDPSLSSLESSWGRWISIR